MWGRECGGGRSVVGSLWPVLVEETQLYIISVEEGVWGRECRGGSVGEGV